MRERRGSADVDVPNVHIPFFIVDEAQVRPIISANTHHVATLQALDATTNTHPQIAQFADTARAGLLFGEADVSRLAEAAIERWDMVLDAAVAPLMIGQPGVTVAPSLGIALFPVDGATVDELLEKAGAAMLEAKRRQSGYAFFLKQRDGFSLTTSRPSQSVQAHHAIQAPKAQRVGATYA